MSVKFTKKDIELDSGDCFRDLNLLAHAQLIELDLGSQCGGHGKCGADRVMLSSDDLRRVNPPTEIEMHQLTQDELKRGVRLACQCFPNSNDDTLIVVSLAGEGSR